MTRASRVLSGSEVGKCRNVLLGLALGWQDIAPNDEILELLLESCDDSPVLAMRRPVLEVRHKTGELYRWQVFMLAKNGLIRLAYIADNRRENGPQSGQTRLFLANEVLLGPAVRMSLEAVWSLLATIGIQPNPIIGASGSEATAYDNLARVERVLDEPIGKLRALAAEAAHTPR